MICHFTFSNELTLVQFIFQVESTEVGRKESITIDIEAGESSDLVEEVLIIIITGTLAVFRFYKISTC